MLNWKIINFNGFRCVNKVLLKMFAGHRLCTTNPEGRRPQLKLAFPHCPVISDWWNPNESYMRSKLPGWSDLKPNKIMCGVPAGQRSSGCQQTYWNWFHRERAERQERRCNGKGCDGFPTSIPARFLSDDRWSHGDCHLHLWLGTRRQNDRCFLDRSTDLVFLWCDHLEEMA